MQVFDIKVHLSNKKNSSYLELPKDVVDKFTNNGKEEAFLVCLPFRHSSVLKSFGVTKEEFGQNFEKSGLACSLLTLSQYYQLLYITVPRICSGDVLKKEEYMRYFGSRTSPSKNNRFMISDYQKCNFVGGNFKLIVNPDSKRSLAEIMEDNNIKKLAHLLQIKKLKANTTKKVAQKPNKKLVIKAMKKETPKSIKDATKLTKTERKKPVSPRNQIVKYNAKNPDGQTIK